MKTSTEFTGGKIRPLDESELCEKYGIAQPDICLSSEARIESKAELRCASFFDPLLTAALDKIRKLETERDDAIAHKPLLEQYLAQSRKETLVQKERCRSASLRLRDHTSAPNGGPKNLEDYVREIVDHVVELEEKLHHEEVQRGKIYVATTPPFNYRPLDECKELELGPSEYAFLSLGASSICTAAKTNTGLWFTPDGEVADGFILYHGLEPVVLPEDS